MATAEAPPVAKRRATDFLFAPVDGSSLALFRIAFGITILWEVLRYLDGTWIRYYWLNPPFHFTYRFFEWIQPWPGNGLYYHFVVMGLAALGMIFGIAYRFCAAIVFLAFTYIFLLEQSQYLNHFYLICLLGFLLIFLPADRCFSVRGWRKGDDQPGTVPIWAVWLLQFQIGVPYFFGGIAKINSEWLRGEPMRAWLGERTDFPWIGQFFVEEWAVYFFVYGGLLLDLLIAPFMLIRRTRNIALLLGCSFHLLNTRLFSIGVFPWFMMIGTTIFYEPDWPRRMLHDVWTRPNRRGTVAVLGALVGGLLVVGIHEEVALLPTIAGTVTFALLAWSVIGSRIEVSSEPQVSDGLLEASGRPALASGRLGNAQMRVFGATVLALWVSSQCLLPLRHYLIPGNVSWTEEGHRFAWHMKLRDKEGKTLFMVSDPNTGTESQVDPRDILTARQYRKMSTRPYMIQKFAKHLAAEMESKGFPGTPVRARALASLNGRPWQMLIDPTVDLAAEPYGNAPAHWIIPLQPLEPESEGGDAAQASPPSEVP